MCRLVSRPVTGIPCPCHVTRTEKKGINNVTPLFISVDPKRDTVGQMKNYSQDFHPSIQYLTGTREQVAAAAKAYRVYFSKVPSVP